MTLNRYCLALFLFLSTVANAAQDWVGAIGIDYNPNHYKRGIILNDHDVFYVGMNAGKPVTNVYMELSQLQAAGFDIARSYQTVEYSWIDIIEQANVLGLKVVYEANIPQNPSLGQIAEAVKVLNNVINAVGTKTFMDTVNLVLAGHENYSNTDVNDLIAAVRALQGALLANKLIIPVSSALVSGNLVTPPPGDGIDRLVKSYSPNAPLGFDPYPFQWGVPVDKAVSTSPPPQERNSIAWDYQQVMQQSFYTGQAILMAETGWATEGTNADYFCAKHPQEFPCKPGVDNAATYLTALYAYVRDVAHNSGALIFEAYDEPAKNPNNPNDAENHYGLFDSNCKLKNNDRQLLPNPRYNPTDNYGCQGFAQGALFVAVGGRVQGQPPFNVRIDQTNPVTNQDASMLVNVLTEDRNNTDINPWPYFLMYDKAKFTLTGSSGTVCTGTASVSGVLPRLTLPDKLDCKNSSGPVLQVNCSYSNCYLPANF